MKKALFLLAIMVMASGCGAARTAGRTAGSRQFQFNLFPRLDVEVYNDCYASTIYVKRPGGSEVAIGYGNSDTLDLKRFPGEDSTVRLSARGVGSEGAYLGSDSRSFSYPQSGRKDETWHVGYLQNGERQCQR